VTVVDASAVIEVLLRTPSAPLIEGRLLGVGQLHAPYLIDVEVTQALRRYEAKRVLTAERGRAALAVFTAIPIWHWPHDLLLPRIWELRRNLTAYDAAYVALAEALDATLLTRDKKLVAASGHHARVELV
jgi:predicted nucleic acid-binding protein